MPVRAEAFLDIESSLADRLYAAWQRESRPFLRRIWAALEKGDTAHAIDLAVALDLSPIIRKNLNYINYLSQNALLFGATRVTSDPHATSIPKGNFDDVLAASQSLLHSAVHYNVEDHLRFTLLEAISAYDLNNPATNFTPSDGRFDDYVFKEYDPNQPRDEQGQWTAVGGPTYFKESLGFKRSEMPQIRGRDMAEFAQWAAEQGVSITAEVVPATSLRPAQNEYNPRQAAQMTPEALSYPLTISRDNYVLDGTNRWVRLRDEDKDIEVRRIDLPGKEALALMHRFPKAFAKDVSQIGETIQKYDPNPNRHPAGSSEGGKFAPKGGVAAGAAPAKPAYTPVPPLSEDIRKKANDYADQQVAAWVKGGPSEIGKYASIPSDQQELAKTYLHASLRERYLTDHPLTEDVYNQQMQLLDDLRKVDPKGAEAFAQYVRSPDGINNVFRDEGKFPKGKAREYAKGVFSRTIDEELKKEGIPREWWGYSADPVFKLPQVPPAVRERITALAEAREHEAETRGWQEETAKNIPLAKALENVIANAAPPLAEDVVLYRRVDSFRGMKGSGKGGALKPGDKISLAGITSTTTDLKRISGKKVIGEHEDDDEIFGDNVIKIVVPKGSKNVLFTSNSKEREVLLNHGAELTVVYKGNPNRVGTLDLAVVYTGNTIHKADTTTTVINLGPFGTPLKVLDALPILTLKYDPDQPRVPAGESGGGRWASPGQGTLEGFSYSDAANKLWEKINEIRNIPVTQYTEEHKELMKKYVAQWAEAKAMDEVDLFNQGKRALDSALLSEHSLTIDKIDPALHDIARDFVLAHAKDKLYAERMGRTYAEKVHEDMRMTREDLREIDPAGERALDDYIGPEYTAINASYRGVEFDLDRHDSVYSEYYEQFYREKLEELNVTEHDASPEQSTEADEYAQEKASLAAEDDWNDRVRQGKQTGEKIEDLIEEAAPPVPESIILHRGVYRLEDMDPGGFKSGDTISLEGFTSTSSNPNTAMTFGGDQLMILTPKGADNVLFTSNDPEKEVILNHGTELTVLGSRPGTVYAYYHGRASAASTTKKEKTVYHINFGRMPTPPKVIKKNKVTKYDPDQPRDEQGRWTNDAPPSGNREDFTKAMYSREGITDLSYDQMVEKLGQERVFAVFDEVRKEQHAWDKQMKRALSLNTISIKDARSQGAISSSMELEKLKELPPTLYHVTTAVDDVIKNGLKTRDELGQSLGKGLGGGTSDTISFTDDKNIADDIKDAMLLVHDVLNDKVSVESLIDKATKGEDAKRPYMKFISDAWGGRLTEAGIPLQLDAMLRGRSVERVGPMDKKYPLGQLAVDDPQVGEKLARHLGPEYQSEGEFFVSRPATEKEINDTKMSFMKKYLFGRDAHGGKLDPLFFLTDENAFKAAPRDNIQTLAVNPKQGTRGYQVSSLGEWRAWTGDVVDEIRVVDRKMELIWKYDEDQPRDPKGTPTGGQWSKQVREETVGMTFNMEKKQWEHPSKKISEADQARMRALVVPPGWTNVHINPDETAPLQVLGQDAAGRWQPRYSVEHTKEAALAKFARGRDFAKIAPQVTAAIERDMSDPDKVNEAAAMRLIQQTGIRIGGEKGEGVAHTAIGASNLKGQHVKVDGDKITLAFTGKSGVRQHMTLTDPLLSGYLRGKNLEKGKLVFDTTDAKMRDYFKSVAGDEFKVKDVRMWVGTATALKELKKVRQPKNEKEFKAMAKEVAVKVSKVLGNTPAMSMKAYIDPLVWQPWNEKFPGALEPKKRVKKSDLEDMQELLEEFYESVSFDAPLPDWHEFPATDLDPDDDEQDARQLEKDQDDPLDLRREKKKAEEIISKAEIVHPFVSFRERADTEAQRMLQLISGLHTSRLSAFGFTVEAEVTGVTTYAISAQLDNRVCDVCEHMHGRQFQVSDAQEALGDILKADDPEDLRTLQPWPGQSKQDMSEMREMTNEELIDRNWHIPPYHPNCRCLLVKVEDVHDVTATPSYRAAHPTLDSVFTNAAVVAQALSVDDAIRIRTLLANESGKQTKRIWNELKGRYDISVLEALMGTKDYFVQSGGVSFPWET